MRTIYKKISNPDSEAKFQQKFIAEGEEIPEGWTDNLDNLNMPEEEPTEMEAIKQQIVDLQDIISQFSGGV